MNGFKETLVGLAVIFGFLLACSMQEQCFFASSSQSFPVLAKAEISVHQ